MEFSHRDKALYNYLVSEYLSRRLIQISPEKSDYLASTLNNIGICLYQQGRSSKAISYFEEAKKIRGKNKDLDGTSRSLHYLSICHEANKDYDEAMECVNEIKSIRDNQQDFSGILEEEKEKLEEELQERQKQHDRQGVAGINCDLGMIYERMRTELMDNSETCHGYTAKIDKLNQEAKKHYRSSLETKALPEACIAQILNHLGEIYFFENNLIEAKRLVEASLQTSRNLEKGYLHSVDQLYLTAHHCTLVKYSPEGRGSIEAWIAHSYQILANICLAEGDTDKAREYMDDSLKRKCA